VIINSLSLKNFRNLNVDVKLSPNVNIIFGENAAGKTNFLDSIYYLCYGKSFRPYAASTEINWDTDSAFGTIAAYFAQSIDLCKIVFSGNNIDKKNTKRFLFGESGTTRNKFTQGKKLILFTPHLLNIIAGTPADRRDELDIFLSNIDYKYAGLLKRYKSIVKNRNKLLQKLQSGYGDNTQLDFWNEKLLLDGTEIITKRIDFFKELDPILDESAKKLFNKYGDFSLQYFSKFTSGNSILEEFKTKLNQNLQKEIYAGRTLYGPHREDWAIYLDNRDLKLYGSRGQQRLAALIIKFAFWIYVSKTDDQPIPILLDDIFSELDKKNSEKLQKFFMNLDTQIFITTANKSEIISDWKNIMEITL